MSSFTKSQSEAIRHQDGPLLVLAGSRFGKNYRCNKKSPVPGAGLSYFPLLHSGDYLHQGSSHGNEGALFAPGGTV